MWAYYLAESRLVARGERPQKQTLSNLVQWKLDQREKAQALLKATTGQDGGVGDLSVAEV